MCGLEVTRESFQYIYVHCQPPRFSWWDQEEIHICDSMEDVAETWKIEAET